MDAAWLLTTVRREQHHRPPTNHMCMEDASQVRSERFGRGTYRMLPHAIMIMTRARVVKQQGSEVHAHNSSSSQLPLGNSLAPQFQSPVGWQCSMGVVTLTDTMKRDC